MKSIEDVARDYNPAFWTDVRDSATTIILTLATPYLGKLCEPILEPIADCIMKYFC